MTVPQDPFCPTPEFVRQGPGGVVLHDCACTVAHWQLRDLVHMGDSLDEVYVVHSTATIKHQTQTNENLVTQALSFAPSSMTYNLGYLAAGGQQAELDVRDVHAGTTLYAGSIDGSVNNALHIAKLPDGGVQLFVCNNDRTIKIFELPSMQPCHSIRCSTAINYTALSPDCSYLAAVGDCPTTFVYARRESGYYLLLSLTEATDVGMTCAWGAAYGGSCIASAHQDGTVCVWDVRDARVVHKRRLRGAAARNVKMSPRVIDLMAIAEHEGCVHLIDTRKWQECQKLNLAQHGGGSEIAGITFSDEGRRLYVGTDENIVAFELDGEGRRSFASAAFA